MKCLVVQTQPKLSAYGENFLFSYLLHEHYVVTYLLF